MRQAAVDLLGAHIVGRADLAAAYFDTLVAASKDASTSVRGSLISKRSRNAGQYAFHVELPCMHASIPGAVALLSKGVVLEHNLFAASLGMLCLYVGRLIQTMLNRSCEAAITLARTLLPFMNFEGTTPNMRCLAAGAQGRAAHPVGGVHPHAGVPARQRGMRGHAAARGGR